jgi:hypothetical protein
LHFQSHFPPYLPCFQSLTRSVEDAARLYLHGLFPCRRRNLEKMVAETVSGSPYQRLHPMLSESAWDRGGVSYDRFWCMDAGARVEQKAYLC